jgi:predicted enzyme related to lactoylglutathione lyase
MKRKHFTKALLIGLASLWFTGCADIVEPAKKSEPQVLPSITSTVTAERHHGKFVWHDLLTDDIRSAREFYADVFGWTFKTKQSYTQVFNQDQLIGGMMHVTPADEKDTKAVWLPTMSVSDVDTSARYVKFKKGEVLKGPIDMKERGRGVLVSDPQGAQIVLLRTKNGDPKDKTPQIGDWLWNELWTNKPKESYTFYRNIGGYDGYEMRDKYRIVKHKGKWRAGIRDIDKDDFKARWVPTIRVADLKETMSKVKASGGEVLVAPDEELVNGNVALIADNNGAAVIIQYWEEGGA